MNFTESEALTRIFPYLVRLVLPRGAVDLGRKIPPSDIDLVATTNVVLVRKEIHPAIIDLLTNAILEAHSAPGLFQKVGDFPTQTDPEYPIAQGARDFYKSGPSYMNRYLPFWMTSYVQRIIAVLVAVIAIVLPVFNYAPKLYLWFIRERVRRLYRRLRVSRTRTANRAQLFSGPSPPKRPGEHRSGSDYSSQAQLRPVFDFNRHIEATRAHLASRLVRCEPQPKLRRPQLIGSQRRFSQCPLVVVQGREGTRADID
jgi:hypothetical protein